MSVTIFLNDKGQCRALTEELPESSVRVENKDLVIGLLISIGPAMVLEDHLYTLPDEYAIRLRMIDHNSNTHEYMDLERVGVIYRVESPTKEETETLDEMWH